MKQCKLCGKDISDRANNAATWKVYRWRKSQNGCITAIGIQSGCTNVHCNLSANSVQGIPAQVDLYRTVKTLSEAFQSD